MTRLKRKKYRLAPGARPKMYNTALIRQFVETCGGIKIASDLVGVNQMTVRSAIKGGNIRMGTFYAFVEALGVTPGEMIGCPCSQQD